MPASIVLNYHHKTQKYSIDSDKTLEVDTDCPDSTILSSLGHVLEKLFVLSHDQFSKLLKKNQHMLDPNKCKVREAYAFAKTNLLMTRSQLDCHDQKLPGNGTFDIKTRATIAIRHDRLNHANAAGYQIRTSQGPLESFEREYLDLIRSAFLKYQFQARIGQMDGCFVAYHNTQRVFGFQYVPIVNMDAALFGTTEEGDKVFKLCLGYMERVLEDATKVYPEQTLRITTFSKCQGNMWVFVIPDTKEILGREPPTEYTVLQYQSYNYLNGEIVEDRYVDVAAFARANNNDPLVSSEVLKVDREKLDWSVYCQVWKHAKSEASDQLYRFIRKNQYAISQLVLPEGVDRQLMRVVNWPETNEGATNAEGGDLAAGPLDSSNPHSFVPTPGVKYKTEASQFVKQLRLIAKEGWDFLKKSKELQNGQKIISMAPVEYQVQDRIQPASRDSTWQEKMIEEEQQRRQKALEMLKKGEQRMKYRESS